MPIDIDAYLERIDYHGPREPTAVLLAELQRRHLLAVPFENLDIHLGRPLSLDVGALFDKVVRQRRGGFCYELGGLFAELLKQLGFDVALHAARVYNDDGVLGPERDHLVLGVACDGQPWLVEVGFGSATIEPIRLGALAVWQRTRYHRALGEGSKYVYASSADGATFRREYCLGLEPLLLTDFEPMCAYQQTSTNSHFTRRLVCTRLTVLGRKTLSGRTLTVTEDGTKTKTELASPESLRDAFAKHFGVALRADESATLFA